MNEVDVWLLHGLIWLVAAFVVFSASVTEREKEWGYVWWVRLKVLCALWLIYTAGVILGTGLAQ